MGTMATLENAVLGGGALGLTLAYRLALGGERVVVMEREDEAGGLAAGFPVGERGAYLEKFYHHLFQSDAAALALIEELGLGSRLSWDTPNSSLLYQDRAYQLAGTVSSILGITPLPLLDRLRLGAAGAFLKALPSPAILEGQTAAVWLRRWMGKPAYEVVWEPQLRGKFGDYADEIAMPWMWARIHCRTNSLGYLRGGFQCLYEALVAAIEAHGGEVRRSTEVKAVKPDGSGALQVVSSAGEERYDRVVSTLASRVTFKIAPDLPADFRRQYEWGAAYGAHCLILALDRPLLKDIYWLSITDRRYPFLAVVEHTNYMPASDYDGLHLVYFGSYLPMDHAIMRESTDEVFSRYLPHIGRLNAEFSPEWIRQKWSFAAPYAQPIVTTDYRRHIPPHETPIPNFYMANMFQVYPQDRGQNYSILLANKLAERLLAGKAG